MGLLCFASEAVSFLRSPRHYKCCESTVRLDLTGAVQLVLDGACRATRGYSITPGCASKQASRMPCAVTGSSEMSPACGLRKRLPHRGAGGGFVQLMKRVTPLVTQDLWSTTGDGSTGGPRDRARPDTGRPGCSLRSWGPWSSNPPRGPGTRTALAASSIAALPPCLTTKDGDARVHSSGQGALSEYGPGFRPNSTNH